MWYVETPEGDMEQVQNRATAEYLAKQYDTRYMDGWSQRSFTPEVG
jgi:hypothetical protein